MMTEILPASDGLERFDVFDSIDLSNPLTRDVAKVIGAQDAFPTGWVPSRKVHIERNLYNRCVSPTSQLIETVDLWYPNNKKGVPRKYAKGRPVYVDSTTGTRWIQQPWHLSIFHKPCTQFKFLALDEECVPSGRGSSEIIVEKKSCKISSTTGHAHFSGYDVIKGSYNYRTTTARHWFADILPVLFYRHRVGA